MSRTIYIIRCIYVFSDRDNGDPNLLSGKLDRPHNTPLTYICILLSESIARNEIGFVQLDTFLCQFSGRFYPSSLGLI